MVFHLITSGYADEYVSIAVQVFPKGLPPVPNFRHPDTGKTAAEFVILWIRGGQGSRFDQET